MGQSLPKPGLRPFLPADMPALVEIFQASIEELTGEDYSEAQQEAWMMQADDADFAQKLTKDLTLIATLEGSAVGFIALKDNELIELFHVHPAVAGQGIGTMLYDAVEKLATARGASRLVAEVSDNAQPFFQKQGFQPQRRNTLSLGDEWLGTTTMEKRLASAEDRKLSS
ncbi:GNAT family N-acetyltransferase [Microvirga guangxiensis]|uniref:Putative acetyltransferase n=1 Tax=Microvirga guangxiensis TaxID=549386 RepID=A0A1G5BVQ7_9HYPH|nr:GNAT family N-acetyltransferase [Microvirga guangxiensis]SCX94272.1 putative acetyltransferase [Microvirga guangxiensis]